MNSVYECFKAENHQWLYIFSSLYFQLKFSRTPNHMFFFLTLNWKYNYVQKVYSIHNFNIVCDNYRLFHTLDSKSNVAYYSVLCKYNIQITVLFCLQIYVLHYAISSNLFKKQWWWCLWSPWDIEIGYRTCSSLRGAMPLRDNSNTQLIRRAGWIYVSCLENITFLGIDRHFA